MTPPIPLRQEALPPESTGISPVTILRLALETLSQRVLIWLVTLAAGGIWLWTVVHPDLLRILSASLYSATVLWPYLYVGRSRD